MAKKKEVNIDIIKISKDIKEMLWKRLFSDLRLNYSDICNEAEQYGISLQKNQLSNYFSDVKSKPSTNKVMAASMSKWQGLKQENIMWLCRRYGVDVELGVYDNKNYENSQGIKDALTWINFCNKLKGNPPIRYGDK